MSRKPKQENIRLPLVSATGILACLLLNTYLLRDGFAHTYLDELLTVPLLCCLLRSVQPSIRGRMLPWQLLAACGGIEATRFVWRCGHDMPTGITSQGLLRLTLPNVKVFVLEAIGAACYCAVNALVHWLVPLLRKKTGRREKILLRFKITLLLAALLIGGVYGVWENNAIEISRYTYQTGRWVQDGGFRIVQVTDLHNKAFGMHSRFLLNAIQSENPDIIVVTGDLVDANRTNIPLALDFMQQATAIAPTFFVCGNHEQSLPKAEFNEFMDALENTGCNVLRDECVTLDAGGFDIHLIGMLYTHLTRGKIDRLIPGDDGLNILLAHAPEYLDRYAATGVDIVFSGHAHGGQFRLPFIGGLYAPGQGFFPKYTGGVYQKDNTTLYLSRGLGNSVIPVRLGNRPEILTVDLV